MAIRVSSWKHLFTLIHTLKNYLSSLCSYHNKLTIHSILLLPYSQYHIHNCITIRKCYSGTISIWWEESCSRPSIFHTWEVARSSRGIKYVLNPVFFGYLCIWAKWRSLWSGLVKSKGICKGNPCKVTCNLKREGPRERFTKIEACSSKGKSKPTT